MNPSSPAPKENARVKSSRVTWSQAYQKHLNELPTSSLPLRSILKNRVNQLIFMAPQDLPAELPTTTNDPLRSATYFKSPIETLLESTEFDSSDHVSQNDLLDAYNTLQTRIRAHIQAICQSSRDLLAWNAIKLYSSQIFQVLRRDIRRALTGPLSSPHQRSPSSEGSSFSNDLEITEDDIKNARDSSLVCHQSLRLLSDLLRFPALYSIFSINHLDVLFDDLLTILLARSLPTHNSRKTQALIIWIIQIQRLPSTILAPKKREIASILKLALDGHFDQDGKSNVISDGLEAIHDFLRYHASHFLSPLSELLPSILPHLLSPSFEDRLHVAHALGGFVLAKIATPSSSDIHGTISRHVGSFIDAQSSKFTSTRYGARLATLLTAALAVENPSHPGHGPSWALTVLASLTVLSDSSLFSHPRSLRLIFPPLAQAQTHNHRSVRSLVPHVWKCFIWDFLRMSPEECQGEATRSSHVDSPINFEERAFLVVKQELRGGIGVALVNSLLEQSEALGHSAPRFGGDRTARALTVVKDMVCSEDKATHDQGLSLLTRLVGAIGSPCITIPKQATWNCNKILAQSLFDGTILNTRWKDLSAAVHTIHDCETDEVRQLSEQEIVQHWDALTSIWIKCVEESLQGTSFQLSTNLIEIWQSLLLAQAQLTQGNCHLTTPQTFTHQVASLVSVFFVPTSQGATFSGEEQLRRLYLGTQLWTVIKNVFTTAWLPSPAESILRSILKRPFDLSDVNVKGAWSKLCSDLVAAGIPSLLELFSIQDEREAGAEAKRQLWSVLAKSLQLSSDKSTWQDAVSFLDVSFGAWTMSDDEIELWDAMLCSAITSAGSANVRPTAVVEHIAERLGSKKVKWLPPQVTLLLFSHVDLGDNGPVPSHCLALFDSVLCDLYPPHPDMLSTALRHLRLLRDIITPAPSSLIVTILVAFRRSLCRWIEDQSGVIAEEEYNGVIMALYCDSLSILRSHVPSVEILQELGPFLAAGFARIPPPSLGPLAFGDFWRATYHGLAQFYSVYPESIIDCLKALDQAFKLEGDLRLGLSLDSDSQLTPSSIVPDSQLSRGSRVNAHDDDVYRFHLEGATTRPNANDLTGSYKPSALSHATVQCPLPAVYSTDPENPSPPHLGWLCEQPAEASSSLTSANISGTPIGRDGSKPLSRSVHISSNTEQAGMGTLLPSKLDSAFSLRAKASRPKRAPANDASAKPSKRRRTDPSVSSVQRAKKGAVRISRDGSSLHDLHFDQLRQNTKKSASEPITRMISPAPGYSGPASQPNASRKRTLFDYVELPTYRQVLKRKNSEATTRSSNKSPSIRTHTPTLSYDDYDSWETALSTPALRRARRELVQAASSKSSIKEDDRQVLSPDYPETDFAKSRYGDSPSNIGTDLVVDSSSIPDRPSPRLTVKRNNGRSQTAPAPVQPSRPMPLRRSKTTSVRLDALERAYTMVANGASPIPIEDLLQATKLVHQIGAVLAEHMSRALGDIE